MLGRDSILISYCNWDLIELCHVQPRHSRRALIVVLVLMLVLFAEVWQIEKTANIQNHPFLGWIAVGMNGDY